MDKIPLYLLTINKWYQLNLNNKFDDHRFIEYNPIRIGKGIIEEPVSFLTTFSMLPISNIYNKKNNYLNLLHKFGTHSLMLSTLLLHSTQSNFGRVYEMKTLNIYIINIIIKYLSNVYNISNKSNVLLFIYFLECVYIYSHFYKKNFKDTITNNITYILSTIIIIILVNIFTNNNKLLNIFTNIIVILLLTIIPHYNSKNIFKSILQTYIDIINKKNILSNLLKSQLIITIPIALFLNQINNKKYNNSKIDIIKSLITLSIGFIFEEEIIKIKTNPKSLVQFHAIWHIIGFYSLYKLEKIIKI
tara:strand:+ start:1211 stop:2119 length:909 start_codon:yes stop_codon:yes gene_type:complete